jgi:hypothetical protein
MDIFATTVTSCQLIYAFLDGCRGVSVDAKSIAVRFEHDTTALQKVLDYFTGLAIRDASGTLVLSPEHQIILDDCVRNLEGLFSKAIALGTRIKSKKWYRTTLNHTTWWLYRASSKNSLKSCLNGPSDWTCVLSVFLTPSSTSSTSRIRKPTRP